MAIDLTRALRELRLHFWRIRRVDKAYIQKLVAIARQVGVIIKGFAPEGEVTNLPGLMYSMERYAGVLEPWAETVATRLIQEIDHRDKAAWHALSRQMGQNLREEIENAPTGTLMRQLIANQVDEIKSIPRDAAARVYALATEAHITGARSDKIRAEILATEDVSVARAKMLARTAVATASTTLVESRALYVGSPGYHWRTTKGADVRKDHRELEGTFHRWDDPPVVDKRSGYRSHPGCNANCQCWAQVVLPEPTL
jgi:uncharacterized protein with gpF-like domain